MEKEHFSTSKEKIEVALKECGTWGTAIEVIWNGATWIIQKSNNHSLCKRAETVRCTILMWKDFLTNHIILIANRRKIIILIKTSSNNRDYSSMIQLLKIFALMTFPLLLMPVDTIEYQSYFKSFTQNLMYTPRRPINNIGITVCTAKILFNAFQYVWI